MTRVTRLYIPPKTRLQTVWREIGRNGQARWHIYTACPDHNAPFDKMLGTSLILCCDGSAERHTVRPDNEDFMNVMPQWKGE